MGERAGWGLPEGGTVALVSGGGTGGHLYPALALGRALVEERPDVRAFYLGASRGIEARVLPERGVPHHLLPVRGFERGAVLANVGAVARLVRSVFRTARIVRDLDPGVAIVTGGYAGAPVGVTAALFRIPLVLQEQNSVPGLVNRILSRFARQVHVAFPEVADHLPGSARARVRASGNPVTPPGEVDGARARREFGLGAEGPVLLVVGGSQGSRALNERTLEAVRGVEAGELARPSGLSLLWATGPTHLEGIRAELESLGSPEWVRAVGYIDDMSSALAVADVAVSRAGAMATSEFLAWGLPSVLLPLPTAAADHQTRNAEALEGAGAALHLSEAETDGAALWEAAASLAGDPPRRSGMARAARERGRPDAARQIARRIADLLPPPSIGGEGGEAAR